MYGENARDVVMFESEQFGKVAVVCIGAMMVGSICLTADEGTYLHRADELGYFAFGGSTIVVLWQKDTLTFDQDLVDNSEKTIETLVMLVFIHVQMDWLYINTYVLLGPCWSPNWPSTPMMYFTPYPQHTHKHAHTFML